MRVFVLIIVLQLINTSLFAQKKLQDSIVVLHQQVDSMKSLLADARRDAKKCSDLLNVLKDKIEQQIITSDAKLNELVQQNRELYQRLQVMTDSLESSVKAVAILQKILSENAIAQNAANNRSRQLVEKLKDSLVDIPKNLCYIYCSDKNAFVVLSDTLIFGQNSNLSNQGKIFLEKLLKLLMEEPSTYINIKTFANPSAKNQDVWMQANNRARQITLFFENKNFPLERYQTQSSASRPEHFGYKMPPTILEIIFK
jgi:hypothetical protein